MLIFSIITALEFLGSLRLFVLMVIAHYFPAKQGWDYTYQNGSPISITDAWRHCKMVLKKNNTSSWRVKYGYFNEVGAPSGGMMVIFVLVVKHEEHKESSRYDRIYSCNWYIAILSPDPNHYSRNSDCEKGVWSSTKLAGRTARIPRLACT